MRRPFGEARSGAMGECRAGCAPRVRVDVPTGDGDWEFCEIDNIEEG